MTTVERVTFPSGNQSLAIGMDPPGFVPEYGDRIALPSPMWTAEQNGGSPSKGKEGWMLERLPVASPSCPRKSHGIKY